MRKALYHYIDRAVVTRKVEERMNWSASFIIHCKYLKGLRDCEGKVCGVYRERIKGIERKKPIMKIGKHQLLQGLPATITALVKAGKCQW